MEYTRKKDELIHHFLENSAALHSEKIAVIHDDVRATYADINSQANSFAMWLREHGLQTGNRVVILLANGPEYIVSYYGTLKAGAVAVPFGTDLKPEGILPLLRELEASVIISSSRFERVLKNIPFSDLAVQDLVLVNPRLSWQDTPVCVTSWTEAISTKNQTNPEFNVRPQSLASIIYTSGSTGEPKGVMLSHRNIVVNTKSICHYLQLNAKDIQMVVLPFFYVMGKSLLNTHFAVGGTLVLNNKFAFPASIVKQLAEENITGFSGVPSTYAHLLHRSPLASFKDKLPALRYCSQAGGHMAHHVKLQLKKALPNHTKIYIMYGATEASARLSYLEPSEIENRINSIGKPIPDTELEILDVADTPLGHGDIGEIVARGDNIMMGYWRDPETTSKVLRNSTYYTGDLGYRDEDGFFYITSRKDQMLKVGGHRINPQEVEDAIMATGLAIECVVLGIPDDLLGKRLVAVVVKKDEGTENDNLYFACAQRLPRFKIPSEFRSVLKLPLNANGKIDRNACYRLASIV